MKTDWGKKEKRLNLAYRIIACGFLICLSLLIAYMVTGKLLFIALVIACNCIYPFIALFFLNKKTKILKLKNIK
ncbi:MAG: hypothetical protein FWF52_02410 [Candidatus Azobacteroides sp.]|nr:hypothetical protein [Candidatus Azobacteroides sp.]